MPQPPVTTARRPPRIISHRGTVRVAVPAPGLRARPAEPPLSGQPGLPPRPHPGDSRHGRLELGGRGHKRIQRRGLRRRSWVLPDRRAHPVHTPCEPGPPEPRRRQRGVSKTRQLRFLRQRVLHYTALDDDESYYSFLDDDPLNDSLRNAGSSSGDLSNIRRREILGDLLRRANSAGVAAKVEDIVAVPPSSTRGR